MKRGASALKSQARGRGFFSIRATIEPRIAARPGKFSMRPSIGATTYVFRYLLGDAAWAPPLADLPRLARAAGLDRLQICENARPLELGTSAWAELRHNA